MTLYENVKFSITVETLYNKVIGTDREMLFVISHILLYQ